MIAINSTKKISRSSGSIFSVISSMRRLHIEAKHIINDKEYIPSAIILQTANDIAQAEETPEYQYRSWGDLEKTFPVAFSSKTLLIIKINQSVINSDDWENKKMNPIYTGHVMAGIFRRTDRGLIHLPDTLVSKVPSGMESDNNILNGQFFSSQFRSRKAKTKCSMEYYCVIDINKTVLDMESYQKRCLLLVEKQSPYDLAHNACGQAVFFALTGLKPMSRMSTQIAAVKSLFEIVRDKGDSIFYDGLRDAAVLSQKVGHWSKMSIFAKECAQMISFKWRHFKQDIILMLVRWYVAYSLSYRDIEELALERGLKVDHSTINRWVIFYSPQLEAAFRKRHKRPVGLSWRMDETYIKVRGKWVYLYRAVDKEGKTVDFMLSEKRDEPAARAFFEKAIGSNGLPEKVTMDKSGANKAGIDTINLQLALLFMMGGLFIQLTVRQIKYLNNIVEQDHRFIKKITKPMKGFKAFHAAEATLTGIELHHMLRKEQHSQSDNQTIFEQFYGLAA